MKRRLFHIWADDGAAVAPTVALSLFALIAVGGLAFDYARVATMDTELQTAADQAALAAATQLDGDAGARDRARAAARTLITNSTLAANDGVGMGIAIQNANVTFYSAYTDPTTFTLATSDSDARFVQVQVDSRTAEYAFTPIVAAFSGTTNARAVAGLGSAICGVVPFFVCNPIEPIDNTNVNLPPGGVDPGLGIVLYEGGSSWGPGNFGFMDQLGNGANGVAEALASDALFGNCSATGTVTTKPGNFISAVRDSLNMRMDFKPGNASACKEPPCSPSTNVRKDVVLQNGQTSCNWIQNPATSAQMTTTTPPRYFPDSPTADLSTGTTPQIMGYPRDRCHYFNTNKNNPNYPLCANGRIGDGQWDRGAYFRSNHPGLDYAGNADLGASVTRYQTYLWEAEAANIATRLPVSGNAGNGNYTAYGQPQNRCLAPGVSPDPAGSDRRRITAAVVNCRRVSQTTGLNGKKDLPVAGYIDLFLTEPVIDRSKCTGNGCTPAFGGTNYVNDYASNKDIYAEIIGASGTGQGGAIPQISRRDVPRLIE